VERTPSTQISFGVQWQGDNYYLRADLSYQNAFYGSPANLAEIPDRTILNLSGGMSFSNGLDVDVWVKNATDEEYVSNAFVVIAPFNNQYGEFLGERLTAGITAKYSF